MALPDLRFPRSAARDKVAAAVVQDRWRIEGAAPLLVAVFAYALMLWSGRNLLHDGDTFFHIAAGNWIWAHAQIPSRDPFSFTLRGAPWVAHEWFSELIFAGAYAALGWVGVIAATAAAIAATYYLLARFLVPILPNAAVLIGLAASFLLAAPHLVARPHVLTMPILVAWMIALERARSAKRPPSLLVLPLLTLWANLHAGFVIGLGLIGFYAIEALVAAADARTRRRALLAWSGFFLAAALAAVLTPNGIEGPLFAYRLSRESFALDFISEWHSTDFTRFQPLEIWILGLIALGFLLRPRVPWLRIALILALVHLALIHSRNADLLALIGPMLLAEPVAAALGHAARDDRDGHPTARIYVIGAATVALATILAWFDPIVPHDQRVAPTDALAAAAAAGITGPVFNAYDFGGYLVFAGIAPFVDGRVDVYGDAFMKDYADAVAAHPDALPQLLDRYHIAWTLLTPQMPAVAALDRSPDWVRVYADANAVIHRRRLGLSDPKSGMP